MAECGGDRVQASMWLLLPVTALLSFVVAPLSGKLWIGIPLGVLLAVAVVPGTPPWLALWAGVHALVGLSAGLLGGLLRKQVRAVAVRLWGTPPVAAFGQALADGGWLAIGVYVGAVAALWLVGLLLFHGTFRDTGEIVGFSFVYGEVGYVSSYLQSLKSAGMPPPIPGMRMAGGPDFVRLGIRLLIWAAIMIWVVAGLVVSLWDAVRGQPPTLESCARSGKRAFWRYFGYTLLWGGVWSIAGIGIGMAPLLIHPSQLPGRVYYLVETFILIAAKQAFIIPLVTLAVVGIPARSFLRQHIGRLVSLGVLVTAVRFLVPLAQFVTFPLYLLFILTLARSDDDATVTPPQTFLQAEASPDIDG